MLMRRLELSLDDYDVGPPFPFTGKFLAKLTKIGSHKNLLPILGWGLGTGHSDDDGFYPAGRPKISPDGIYVDVSGASDCTEDAWPGVWNIKEEEKVVFEGDPQTIKQRCNTLFTKPAEGRQDSDD